MATKTKEQRDQERFDKQALMLKKNLILRQKQLQGRVQKTTKEQDDGLHQD